MKTTTTVLFLLALSFTQVYSQWSPLGSGTNQEISAICNFNGSVYAGGFFSTAGGIHANKIARWNGSSWSALGAGIDTTPYGYVYSLLAPSGSPYLYVGGNFTYAGSDHDAYGIATWNGSSWGHLGSGLGGGVHALLDIYPNIYAGGDFVYVRNGLPAKYIAKWNGSSWDTLAGALDGPVMALESYNGQIIAAGDFTHAGSNAVNYVAAWNGSSWTPLGSGLDNFVKSLTVYNGKLIAGGNFTHAGGVSANHIAQWDGNSWTPLGSGLDGFVLSLTGYPYLVAGTFGGTPSYVYKWNGSSWNALDGGTNGNVYALNFRQYTFDTTHYGWELYAGGQFTSAGGTNANFIAKWVIPVGVQSISSEVPSSFKLMQNYPNPFNPATNIEFDLEKNSFVKLVVYDVLGREVAVLVNEEMRAGTYNADWNAANYPSGVYFYRITVDDKISHNNFVDTKKMILVK
jgi:hypothetical protein